jgi:hypothetical protein
MSHGGEPPGDSRELTVALVSSHVAICESASSLHGGVQVFSRSPDVDLLECVCDGGREEIGAGAPGGGESGGEAYGVAGGEGATSNSGGHGVGSSEAPDASTHPLSAVGRETGGTIGAIQSSDRSDAANPACSGPGCHGSGDAGQTSTGYKFGGGE